MSILIVKLNATGDVVRTTSLLRSLPGEITWITARNNLILLQGLERPVRSLAWEQRSEVAGDRFDLVINLEDEHATAEFVSGLAADRRFGAYLGEDGGVRYTEDSRSWFDMSLVSRYGRAQADALKFANRSTYQTLIFEGLGLRFSGQPYMLPKPVITGLTGDVAIAPVAGPVWPMKAWDHYGELTARLQAEGLTVNELPRRDSILEHLGDIVNHRCLVGGDSLPMHLALGLNRRCVTLFNCTSPWEIHDYGLQAKVVSPLLGEFFYKRGTDPRATSAIGIDAVQRAVHAQLESSSR